MRPSEQARRRRVRRLCLSLELDELAGEIIVDLLERMEEMRRDLERLGIVMEDRGRGGR